MYSNKQNYTIEKKTGRYIPINLKATNVVTCINCNQEFSFSEIDAHLQSHIGQNIVQEAYQHITNIQDPLKLQECLSISTAPANQIETQTIMESQLPTNQIYKFHKDKPVYQQRNQFSYQRIMPDVTSKVTGAREDLEISSRVNPLECGLRKIDIEPGDYFENINISSKKFTTKNKTINLFSKSNATVNQITDNFVAPKRKYESVSQYKQNKYSIQIIPQMEQKLQKIQQQPFNPNVIQISFQQGRLSASKPARFSTLEKPQLILKQKLGCAQSHKKFEIQLSKSQKSQKSEKLQHSQHEIHMISSHDHNNSYCTGCGGFYCPVCKSTIPPQYRKIQHENLNNSLQKSRMTVWTTTRH